VENDYQQATTPDSVDVSRLPFNTCKSAMKIWLRNWRNPCELNATMLSRFIG